MAGTFKTQLMLSIVLLVAIAISGCSDNPVDAEDQPVCDHIDADGLVIEHDGQVVASQWRGVVTGEIELELEEEKHEMDFVVTFLDADSTRIVVDPDCTDHSLGWVIDDDTIAQAAAHEGERWTVELEGLAEGETTIQFRAMHGDHADFTSLPIDVHVHEHGDEHAEAEGMILRRSGVDIVTVWQGVVTGQLEVSADGTPQDIQVVFLDHDEDEFTPDDPDYSLGLVVDDTAVADIGTSDGWTFQIDAVAVGNTAITVSLMHDGHADYSAEIPLAVLAAAATPEALMVSEGHTHVVSWNYNGDQAASAAGVLVLEAGEERPSLSVELLGEWVVGGGHGGSHREELSLPNGEYHLEYAVADPSVATLEPMPGAPWALRATGVAGGSTTAVVRLMNGETTVMQTGNLAIVVATPSSGDADADYFLKKNGARIVYVVDGQITPQPAGCAAPAPGQLDVVVGEETDLYLLKYLDGGCDQIDVPSGHTLAFRVADPSVAALTNHPIHWGERTDFHLEGLAAGTTSVIMYLVNESTGEIVLVSPALPIEVSAS